MCRPLPPALLVAAFAVALWAAVDRVVGLGHLPGVNGDEAWYGVQIQRLVDGTSVGWRTPTGNLINPLHSGTLSLWLLLKVFPNALWVLRLPSVISSFAAVALTAYAMRRRLGAEAGLLALLFSATLPVGIVYARLGWDASHGPLMGALGLCFALLGRPVLLGLTFAFALSVHPTNVFLAPFFWVAYAGNAVVTRGWRAGAWRAGLAGALLAAGLPVLALTTAGAHTLSGQSGIVGRLASLAEWKRFTLMLGDFVSGDTSLSYAVGPPLPAYGTMATAVLAGVVVALLLVGLLLRSRSTAVERYLLGGVGLTLIIFYAVAGPSALGIHWDRYGMVLATPLVVALTVLTRRWATGRGSGSIAVGLGLVLAVAALVYVEIGYFGRLRRTGGLSHETFWTGPVEPKELAARRIRTVRDPARRSRVVADSFWILQPLAFLLHGDPELPVEMTSEAALGVAAGEDVYLVGFSNGPFVSLVAQMDAALSVESWNMPGYARPAAIKLWRLRLR